MVVEILVGLEAMQPNMHVVSNFLKYDKEGNILGMKNQLDEIIHVYNKNDKSLNRLGSSKAFMTTEPRARAEPRTPADTACSRRPCHSLCR